MASEDGGLTPGKRKRLQQSFEQANQLMRQENYDYANELFTQCVVGDPANVPYVQSYLANLKLKYNNNKKGSQLAFIQGAGAKGMVKKASMQKDWAGVIKHGLDMLKLNPWHIPTLRSMAVACENLKCQGTPLVYLKMALEPNPKDAAINRLCAQAYDEAGMYDQAITCWHRVEQAKPGDEEAGRAIASLTVKKTIEKADWGKGKDMGDAKFQKGGGAGESGYAFGEVGVRTYLGGTSYANQFFTIGGLTGLIVAVAPSRSTPARAAQPMKLRRSQDSN